MKSWDRQLQRADKEQIVGLDNCRAAVSLHKEQHKSRSTSKNQES
jgi:hypothetical protein